MTTIYNMDDQKSYSNKDLGGNTYYSNSEGKTVFVESWAESFTGVNPSDNLKYYIESSTILIENMPKLNGRYISNYVVNENHINGTEKELVVYYVGVNNKCRVKVTYIDKWTKVKFECY